MLKIPFNGTLGLTTPHLHKGFSYGFPLCSLTRKDIIEGTQGAITYTLPPTNLLFLSYLLHRPQSVETRNKKQEEKRKLIVYRT